MELSQQYLLYRRSVKCVSVYQFWCQNAILVYIYINSQDVWVSIKRHICVCVDEYTNILLMGEVMALLFFFLFTRILLEILSQKEYLITSTRWPESLNLHLTKVYITRNGKLNCIRMSRNMWKSLPNLLIQIFATKFL